jgi:hypothetical protein
VHQFFPIELQEKDGTPIEESYYWFVICQSVPCVLRAHSRRCEARFARSGEPYHYGLDLDVGLSRPAVGDWHLWAPRVILVGGAAFMSDELYKRFKKDRLKPLRYHEATFYDEPWIAEENVPELLQWMQDNPDKAEETQKFFEKKSLK